MLKHPECEDRCQLREHKGYLTCQISGQCTWLEAYREETRERFERFVEAREAEREEE